MTNHMKSALQIRVDYGVESFFFHGEQETIPNDSRVVDENIHLSKFLQDLFRDRFCLLKAGNVALIGADLSPDLRNLLLRLFRRFTVSGVKNGNVCSLLRHGQSNRASDAPGPSGHNGCHIFKRFHSCPPVLRKA